MATVSQSLPEFSPLQRRGLVLTVVGLLLFLAYPVLRLTGVTQSSGPQYGFVMISPYAAGVLVWGVYVFLTDNKRPLTPRRALLIPVLVIAMFAVEDVFTQGMLHNLVEYISHSWDRLHLRILARYVPMLVLAASSTYAVLGAAVSTRRWQAILPAVGLVLLMVWFVSQDPYQPSPVLAVTLFGIVPFVIGYGATQPPADAADD